MCKDCVCAVSKNILKNISGFVKNVGNQCGGKSRILQNAIKVKDDYIISLNTHDFMSYEVGDYQGFIDGGHSYFRRSIIPEELINEIQDFSLTTESSLEEITKKYLIKVKNKYIPASLCNKKELQKAKKSPNYILHNLIIEFWLANM